jgi:hypothetical protein
MPVALIGFLLERIERIDAAGALWRQEQLLRGYSAACRMPPMAAAPAFTAATML